MIELKEICGYLPYKLKFMYSDGKTILNFKPFNITNKWEIENKNIKPILRPLSLLKNYKTEICSLAIKTFEYMELAGIPIFATTAEDWFDKSINDLIEHTCEMQKWELEFCYKNHFDIHGLIEKGDAIEMLPDGSIKK